MALNANVRVVPMLPLKLVFFFTSFLSSFLLAALLLVTIVTIFALVVTLQIVLSYSAICDFNEMTRNEPENVFYEKKASDHHHHHKE